MHGEEDKRGDDCAKCGLLLHPVSDYMAGDSVSSFGRAFISYGSYHYDPVYPVSHPATSGST